MVDLTAVLFDLLRMFQAWNLEDGFRQDGEINLKCLKFRLMRRSHKEEEAQVLNEQPHVYFLQRWIHLAKKKKMALAKAAESEK